MDYRKVLCCFCQLYGIIVILLGIVGDKLINAKLMDISPGSIQEYCQDESFTATCGEGQTIFMTSARYGRLKIGRCIKRSLGFLGCAAEALRFIDSRCSGHQQCDVSIMDPELRALAPCIDEVTWHLDASYDCLEVTTRSRHECHTKNAIQIDASSGFLSSEVAMTTGVGTPTCPWEITAPPGLKINITLYNFVYTSMGGSQMSAGSPCVMVARLGEKTAQKSINACGDDPRASVVYISKSDTLTVSFPGISSPASASGVRTHFLLHYQFVGCPDLANQHGTTVARDGNNMVVRCLKTGETWYLTCDGTKWNGVLGNCTRDTSQTWAIGGIFQSEDNFPFGILIVVAVGVALGIFLGGTLLLVVSIYMKRRRRQQEAQMALHDDGTGYRGAPDDYYHKQQELTEFDLKDDQNNQQTGRIARDDYKITEFRPPFPSSFPPPPRNVHHVYESPKFT